MPEQDTDRLAGLDPLVGVAETIDNTSAEDHRLAVVEEYGQFVATTAITHDGVRAYNVGDSVPATNVDRWGYEGAGLVKRVGSAPAEQEAPADEPTPKGTKAQPATPSDG